MTTDLERVQKRYQREKNARLQAEDILEEKSRELFDKNQALLKLSESLESQVLSRTQDFMEARDQALLSARAKSEFLANMSHELRTPMNGVLGMLTLMADTDLTEQQIEYLRVSKSSGELLLSVINDILDFSKIEAGKMELEHLVFDPRNLLQDVATPLQFSAESKGIKLNLICQENLPIALWGDPTRIKQIISNLVSNAVKFTEKGSVTISIEGAGEVYSIRVTDTGMGMGKEHLSHIFEAFGQGDSSITRTHGGTGLGLTITNRLVQIMGGEVHVSSELGKGSEFSIELPLQVATQAELDSVAKIKQGLFFSQEPILLVEDNEVNQDIAMYLLNAANLCVHLAVNGQEAINLLQQHPFQLILMDLQMPVMDGLEATRIIRSLDSPKKDIPIIAMTAHASTEHIQECKEVGMNAHTTKPIDIDVLLNAVATWIKPSAVVDNKSEAIDEIVTDFEIQNINVSQGLRRVKGNIELYKKLLHTFHKTNIKFAQQARDWIQKEDLQKLKVHFHTLKGSAANISAMDISDKASKFELLAKNGSLSDIECDFESFVAVLEETCENIVQGLNQNKREDDTLSETLSLDEWSGKLRIIVETVHQDFSVADDVINEIARHKLTTEQQEILSILKQQADEFDMDGIAQTISTSRWGY